MHEASLEETPYGRYVTSDGWFVLNLAHAPAVRNEEKGGAVYLLEGSWEPRLVGFGVNVRGVVWPHQPNALYHAEGAQEGFLVLSGECTLVVEEEQRSLRQWDYFHCPAGTRHVIVGAGDGPCAILAIGGRPQGKTVRFPVSDLAAGYGASVAKETNRTRHTPAGRASTSRCGCPGRSAPTRDPDGRAHGRAPHMCGCSR